MTTVAPILIDLAERSPFGLFPPSAEVDVAKALAEDLRAIDAEARNTEGIGIAKRYLAHVSASDRRQRASQVLKRAVEGEVTPDDLADLIEVLYFAGFQRLLAKYHLRFPAYNILDEYFVNARAPWGPVLPKRPKAGQRKWMVLGHRVGFPIGVPASVLTANSSWVGYFARNGFNIITYKTVRTRPYLPHARPNWVFVPTLEEPLPLSSSEEDGVEADPHAWVSAGSADVSTANSFGVPSTAPEEWKADVEETLHILHDDQLLLVSVMGDDYGGTGEASVLANDYALAACHAEEAGAPVIELNLSCPNSLDKQHQVKPPLCEDLDLTRLIVSTTRASLKSDTRLVAKLSYMRDETLRELIVRIAPLVDGVSGINTLQRPVITSEGNPTFPGRPRAGVSGAAIRNHAVEFVRSLARLRVEADEWFDILAMGGVTSPASFEELYTEGASAIQSASGSFANPLLAFDCVRQLGETLPVVPPLRKEAAETAWTRLMQALRRRGPLTRYEMAGEVQVQPSVVLRLIDEGVHEGSLVAVGSKDGETSYLYSEPGAKAP